MEDFKLVTYNSAVPPTGAPAFYILSRGRSAGKPRPRPWKNSMAFYCHPKDTITYYISIHSMWQTGAFRKFLVPSQIPYATISIMQLAIAANIRAFEGIQSYIDRYYNLLGIEVTPNFKIRLLDALKVLLTKTK